MSLTKQDIDDGLKAEIARLTAVIKSVESGKHTVQEHQESGSADITRAFRDNIAECALQLERLKVALELLHVS